MEIKAAPVPSELRFAQQVQSAGFPKHAEGVPWIYVILLCAGSIVFTIAVFHIQHKKRNKSGPFNGFRSKIEE